MYYVYIVKDKISNESLYIGYTNDLRRRLKEHGLTKESLIYYEAYKNESDARDRELQLKKYKNSWGQLKKRISKSRI